MARRMGQRLALAGAAVALGVGALARSGIAAQVTSSIAPLGRLQPGALCAALVSSALGALLSGVLWWRLLHCLGHRVQYSAALAAYLNAGLAGYVVNVAGPALGSALSLRRHGVGPGRAVLLTLLANALGFLGILVWTPLGLLLSGAGMDTALPLLGRFGPVAVDVAVAALAAAMLLALHALATAAGSGHRLGWPLLGRRCTGPQDPRTAPRYRQLLAIVPYSALYVVLAALSPAASISLGTVVSASVVAATLGSLAVFAPEGVGVKDGALVALLVHTTGLPLVMRALDPVTKLGVLGALAATAHAPHARRLGGAVLVLLHRKAAAPRSGGRVALLSAMLAFLVVPAGTGALAHAGRALLADRDARRAVEVGVARAGYQRAPPDAGVPLGCRVVSGGADRLKGGASMRTTLGTRQAKGIQR